MTVPIDIFATKGTEYVLVIIFLASLIIFWRMLNSTTHPESLPQVEPANSKAPTDALGRWFSMAAQRYYHPGHSWLLPESIDTVTIGIDDFAQKLIGEAGELSLPEPGTRLHQGEKGWSLGVGTQQIEFLSPVGGEVIARNERVVEDPALINRDPYGDGWLLKVKTTKLKPNLMGLLFGQLAERWMEMTEGCLRRRVAGDLGLVLQDGGTPVPGIARNLHEGEEDWHYMVREYLLTG
ncbi:glycine cleavage system protein H [Candidatus Zixiibacteriota bacterium]